MKGMAGHVRVCVNCLRGSSFSTHRGSFDPSKLVHAGEEFEDGMGAHTLVVVGWRVSEEGSARFLVQNWWTDKQFFEVDLPYLVSRGAHLTWLMAHVQQVPPQFPVVNAVAAESCVAGVDIDIGPQDMGRVYTRVSRDCEQ